MNKENYYAPKLPALGDLDYLLDTYIAPSIYAALYVYIIYSHQSLPSSSLQCKLSSHMHTHKKANLDRS